MHVLSNLFALAVGFCSWSILKVLLSSGGYNGIDGGLVITAIVAPMVLYSVRKLLSAIEDGHDSSALWIAAMAPVLSFCTLLFAWAFAVILAHYVGKDNGLRGGLAIASAVWLLPFLYRSKDNNEVSRADEGEV